MTVTQWPISGSNNDATLWNSLLYETNGDFIASGLTPTAGATVTLDIAAGVAHCAGIRYAIGAGSATMGKSTTNYVFYDPATLDWHVDTDNTKPTNAVRIARVVCDGTGITNIYDIRQGQPGIPTGVITLWYGSIVSIPYGWHICDGADGTIDLRDRFIVGAGSTYAVAATGGEATHVLTTAEMPAHTHSAMYSAVNDGRFFTDDSGGTKGYTSGSTGGGGAHENRPPYYSLAFIQKL